jgi:HK97 family phage prohead protease
VFNARSANLGGFREEIAPGAFTDALAANEEVLALVEHSPEKILGRRSMGTLTLAQDDKGLRVEIDPPNTTVGNDAVENVRRGDIKGMSFRFPRGAKDLAQRRRRQRPHAPQGRADGGDADQRPRLRRDQRQPPRAERQGGGRDAGLLRAEIAKLKPRPCPPPATPKRNMAEKRLKLLAGESRCGCARPPSSRSTCPTRRNRAVRAVRRRQAVDAATRRRWTR